MDISFMGLRYDRASIGITLYLRKHDTGLLQGGSSDNPRDNERYMRFS